MKFTKEESLKYWQGHIEKSKHCAVSVQSYCKANNLLESSYYYWRDKIYGKKLGLKTKATSKKVKSAFLPVVVSSEQEFECYPQTKRSLPDSQWVAEVITHVIRGLQ